MIIFIYRNNINDIKYDEDKHENMFNDNSISRFIIMLVYMYIHIYCIIPIDQS